MKNELLDKGIILPSGEIGKDKINLVAGAITQPFAEMVWVTTGGDMETINRLTDILVTMNTPRRPGEAVQNHQNALRAYGLALFRGSRAYGRRPHRFGILHLFLYGRLWRSHAGHNRRRKRIATRTAAFLTLYTGRTGTPLFSCPLLRSRGRKSLATSGFPGAYLVRKGIYTLSPETALLLRNKSKAKEL